jgi:hypothetical protein
MNGFKEVEPSVGVIMILKRLSKCMRHIWNIKMNTWSEKLQI